MSTNAQGRELKIGWARADITPDRPMVLAGQMHTRISTRVKDPVTVTALALEGSGARAVWVACDLVGITPEAQARVHELVHAELPDIDPHHLIMSATHTHTSMELRVGNYLEPGIGELSTEEAIEFFAARAARAVIEAWTSRVPGGVSRAYSQAVVAHNRRAVFLDGSAKMYADIRADDFSHFEGYVDHSLDLVCTWSPDGELTGMIVAVPCPSQVTEGISEVSADYWHETRIALRERFGTDLFVLPLCEAAGDLSPHVQVNKRLEEEEMLSRLGRTQREEIALRITAGVDWVFEACKAAVRTEVPFAHIADTLDLPRRMVTEEECAIARASLEAIDADPDRDEAYTYRPRKRDVEIIERYRSQADRPNLPVELHVLRLGDLVFATNPFELFLDFGLRIRARSRAAQTVPVQLTGDIAGYLPTKKAIESKLHAADRNRPGFLGNYSAGVASNQVGPEGGQVLVEATLERIGALFP